MRRFSNSLGPIVLALLASGCTVPREQDPVDPAAVSDLVARIQKTEQEQVGRLLQSLVAQMGEERAIRMLRPILLGGEGGSDVTDKVLRDIGVLGMGALPLVRDAVRVAGLRPASVWALQSYCVGADAESGDHPLTNDDIAYLGSLLESDNSETVKAAAVTLKSAGYRQRLVLSALVQALQRSSARAGSESSGLCSSLLICLGNVGRPALSAVPAILQKFDDEPQGSMRSLLLWTLCRIMPDCAKALTTLIEANSPTGTTMAGKRTIDFDVLCPTDEIENLCTVKVTATKAGGSFDKSFDFAPGTTSTDLAGYWAKALSDAGFTASAKGNQVTIDGITKLDGGASKGRQVSMTLTGGTGVTVELPRDLPDPKTSRAAPVTFSFIGPRRSSAMRSSFLPPAASGLGRTTLRMPLWSGGPIAPRSHCRRPVAR